MRIYFFIFCVGIILFLIAKRATLWIWTCFVGIFLIVFSAFFQLSFNTLVIMWISYLVLAVLLNVKKVRAQVFSRWVFAREKKNLLYSLPVLPTSTQLNPFNPEGKSELVKILSDFKLLTQIMSVNSQMVRGVKRPSEKELLTVQDALVNAAANTYLLHGVFQENEWAQEELPLVTTDRLKNYALKRLQKIANKKDLSHFVLLNDFLYRLQKNEVKENAELKASDHTFREIVLRDHSYFFQELAAIQANDLAQFDKVFFKHFGSFVWNGLACFMLSISQGYLSNAPYSMTKRYFQKIDQFAYAFSTLLDFTLFFSMPNSMREKMLTVLADILGLLSLSSSFLSYLNKADWDEKTLPLVEWIFQSILFDIQELMLKLLNDFPKAWVKYVLRFIIFPYGPLLKKPNAELNGYIAKELLFASDMREKLNLPISEEGAEGYATSKLMEKYFDLFVQAESLELRLANSFKRGEISGEELIQQTTAAVAAGVFTQEEADVLLAVENLRKTKLV